MYFNQESGVFTLKGGSLKLEYKFMYLSTSISSTESVINMLLVKAWNAIDELSYGILTRPIK